MARKGTVRKSMLTDEDEGIQEDAPPAAASNEDEEANPRALIGGNIAGLHDDCREAHEEITQLKKDRQEINAKIKAVRERMEAKGITKTAFDAAMSYVEMSPERREGFDTAYLIAREGLGAPVKGAQAELFSEGGEGSDNG